MYEIYHELVDAIAHGERAVLATVISSQGSAPRHIGAKMLFKHDGSTVGTVGGGGVEQQVREKAVGMLNSGDAQVIHFDLSGSGPDAPMICGGQMDVFIEPVVFKDTLYIFGAGHISRIVAMIGKMLGFTIVVIDPRSEYNNREQFPSADTLEVEDYEVVFSKLEIDESGYIVICTPGHILDERCLHFALGTGAKYIGMIGSNNKVKQIKERLRLHEVSGRQLDALHAPIGVEINAETPAEIAVSIMAEIIKVKNSKDKLVEYEV